MFFSSYLVISRFLTFSSLNNCIRFPPSKNSVYDDSRQEFYIILQRVSLLNDLTVKTIDEQVKKKLFQTYFRDVKIAASRFTSRTRLSSQFFLFFDQWRL